MQFFNRPIPWGSMVLAGLIPLVTLSFDPGAFQRSSRSAKAIFVFVVVGLLAISISGVLLRKMGRSTTVTAWMLLALMAIFSAVYGTHAMVTGPTAFELVSMLCALGTIAFILANVLRKKSTVA